MMTFAEAMAKEEGYGIPGGRATRNNNPGDINWGDTPRSCFARAHGADRIEEIPYGVHEPARFAHFPTPAAGFAAMRALLSVPAQFDALGNVTHGYLGATIAAVVNRWAPSSDGNDTEAYIRGVCRATTFPRDARLTREML